MIHAFIKLNSVTLNISPGITTGEKKIGEKKEKFLKALLARFCREHPNVKWVPSSAR